MRFTVLHAAGIALVCLLSLSLTACGGSLRGRSTLHVGATTKLQPRTLPAEGGRLAFFESGSALNGLEIIVPAGAFDSTRTWSVASAPIERHELGPHFNPISPLITVNNGGGTSALPMQMRIPVSVPEGHFAMAFLYDRTSGRLEGLPLLELDSDHVTLFTRHFSSRAGVVSNASTGAGGSVAPPAQIVVTSVDERRLADGVRSRFREGVDDWQIRDGGTIVQPGGNPSGFSIGMVWYFSELRDSSGPLHGLLDNDGIRRTPHLWMDDGRALRLVTMLQSDWELGGGAMGLDTMASSDTLTAHSLIYAMLLTGEPQLLYRSETFRGPSKAVVVHGYEHGRWLVSQPSSAWVVNLDTLAPGEVPQPGVPAWGAGSLGGTYIGQSAIVDWDAVARHWREVQEGTIGKGVFPSYRIVTLNDRHEYVPLLDGMVVPSPLQVHVIGTGFPGHYNIYDTLGNVISQDPELRVVPRSVELPPGEHVLGFCISDVLQYPSEVHNWAGFEWIRVNVRGVGS